jgi:septum formation protein
MKSPFLYLASQSPRRAQLLDQIGVAHRLLLPDANEDVESLESVHGQEAPATYVQRVTLLKLHAAVQRLHQRDLPAAPVLCADTTVALGRDILGKPQDEADAHRMLRALSGRDHRVLTAVAVAQGRRIRTALSVSVVRFDGLSPSWIAAYVATGEPMGKAGAYAIQGRASARIASIRGSYSGIMGLPLRETAQLIDGCVLAP